LKQNGFSRPIWSYDREAIALLHFEAQVMNDFPIAETEIQVCDAK
jgi:hypothetical protein